MSLIWADSFDHYGTGTVARDNMLAGAWVALGSQVSISSNQARTGNYSLLINSGGTISNTTARRIFPGDGRKLLGIGVGLFFPQLPQDTNESGFSISNSLNQVLLSFAVQPDGSISIKRGSAVSGVSLGASETGVIFSGGWQHIEVAMLIDPIVGWVEIRSEGVTVFRIEDVNTGDTLATSVTYGNVSTFSVHDPFYIDDVFAWDGDGEYNNDFMGPARVLTVFANGNTGANDWVITGADTAYEAVDDVPPDGDTSYITAIDVNDRTEFTLPELPPEIVGLPGIYIPTMGRLVEPGVGRVRLSMVEDGGLPEDGAELSLNPTYSYRGAVFQRNPATGEAWTKEEFEAATLRIEKTL